MNIDETPGRRPRGIHRSPPMVLTLVALALAACSDSPTDPAEANPPPGNPPPVNTPPVADVRADPLATAGAVVTLDGSGSSDADGDALTYRWTQLGGPSVGTLAGTPTPSFSAPNEISELSFRLVVNDGSVDSAPAEVRILVVRDRNRAVFVSPTGTAQGTGSLESPISSLSAALEQAASRQADLYLAAGEWDEALVLRSDMSVFGGFNPVDWSRNPDQHATVIRGASSDSLRFAMRGVGVSNLTVDGVRLEGQQPGTAAVFLSNATDVVLSRIWARAPLGPDGSAGADGPNRGGRARDGLRGENAGLCDRAGGRGGDGGNDGGSGGSGGAIGGFPGSRGGGSASGGQGGAGGALGGTGSPGSDGARGAAGGDGTPGAAFGSIEANGAYAPADGGTGGLGRAGRGGGGGGGGGGALLGSCGGGGGGGGGAGLGGPGGSGGVGGGASVAILLTDGSNVRVMGSHLLTVGGGAGGAGGAGGLGEGSGFGAMGGNAGAITGGGGQGGMGGSGGVGGQGGAGGGGPSIGILAMESQLDESGNQFEIGAPGEGGETGLRAEVHRVD